MQRLRAKVEDDPKAPQAIKTVRGVGYRFDASKSWPPAFPFGRAGYAGDSRLPSCSWPA